MPTKSTEPLDVDARIDRAEIRLGLVGEPCRQAEDEVVQSLAVAAQG
jgi:hypothetical protein